jgi:hypothetical protein
LNSGPTPWATPPALSCDFFFKIGSWELFCPGWLQTTILLISASWIVRITGVSLLQLARISAWGQPISRLPSQPMAEHGGDHLSSPATQGSTNRRILCLGWSRPPQA